MPAITSGSSSERSSGFMGQRSQFPDCAVQTVHRREGPNAIGSHCRQMPGDSQGVGANAPLPLQLAIRLLPEAIRLSSQPQSVPHSTQSAARTPLLRREQVEANLLPPSARESNRGRWRSTAGDSSCLVPQLRSWCRFGLHDPWWLVAGSSPETTAPFCWVDN